MSQFALIDRDTGQFSRLKEMDNPVLATHKQQVYVPVLRETPPIFNADTQKLETNDRAQPLPVTAMTRWKMGHRVVALNPAELRTRAQNKLLALDTDMVRIGEDIIDALIVKGTIALVDLPQRARDILTQRKTLRSDS